LVPADKVAFKRIFSFLKYQSSELGFEKKKLVKLFNALNLKNVEYQGGVFDKIFSKCEEVDFEYYEDGLLVIERKFKKIQEDLKFLENFYQKLVAVFEYIYSKGAPLPPLLMAGQSHRPQPVIIVMSEAKEEEIYKLFKNLGSEAPHAKVIDDDFSVYFAAKYIAIVSSKFASEDCKWLVKLYIFFREYENQLHKYLNINRYLWDQVTGILRREYVHYKELPKLREELLNYREKNILFKNRLNQMNNYLTLRMQEAERMGIIEFLEKYKANRFLKIKSIHDYLLNLWQMTDDSLVSVTELVNTLYQENTQKEINTLQAIFMISVTASFLTLGAMPGAVLKFLI